MRKHIIPKCELLAYCLMPNHFHLLIIANAETVREVKVGCVEMSQFSKGIKDLLSTYAKGINTRLNRTDSLFAKNTNAIPLHDWHSNYDYTTICFNYIHRNPLTAGMVANLDFYPYSSYREYCGRPCEWLCNRKLAKEIIDLDWERLSITTHFDADEDKMLKKIF